MPYPSYENWLETLPEEIRQQAKDLVLKLRSLGALDPEGWARSEISEDIPQFARYLILRRIWPNQINLWADKPAVGLARIIDGAGTQESEVLANSSAAIQRMADLGITEADMGALAAGVAFVTAFDVLGLVDEGHDPQAGEVAPGWALIETDANEALTGRRIGGLHESLSELQATKPTAAA